MSSNTNTNSSASKVNDLTNPSGKSEGNACQSPRNAEKMTLKEFESLLKSLATATSEKRSAMVTAFRASMQDLFHSKSLKRLTMLLDVLPDKKDKAAIKKAALQYSGGVYNGVTGRGSEFIEDLDRSVLFTNSKNALAIREKANWKTARQQYEYMKTIDFDCLITRKPAKPLLKAYYLQDIAGQIRNAVSKNKVDGAYVTLFLKVAADIQSAVEKNSK